MGNPGEGLCECCYAAQHSHYPGLPNPDFDVENQSEPDPEQKAELAELAVF